MQIRRFIYHFSLTNIFIFTLRNHFRCLNLYCKTPTQDKILRDLIVLSVFFFFRIVNFYISYELFWNSFWYFDIDLIFSVLILKTYTKNFYMQCEFDIKIICITVYCQLDISLNLRYKFWKQENRYSENTYKNMLFIYASI